MKRSVTKPGEESLRAIRDLVPSANIFLKKSMSQLYRSAGRRGTLGQECTKLPCHPTLSFGRYTLQVSFMGIIEYPYLKSML